MNLIIEKEFCDIEHDGDMEPIRSAINKEGGKIVREDFNYEAEQWIVEVEVTAENRKDFWGRVDKLVQEYYES